MLFGCGCALFHSTVSRTNVASNEAGSVVAALDQGDDIVQTILRSLAFIRFRSVLLWPYWRMALLSLVTGAGFVPAPAQSTPPILLADVDHRTTMSLDGDWHTIVDPYFSGQYTFHHEARRNGFFMNAKPKKDGGPVEYDFSKSSILKVPGDWNTQRDSLFYYEGPLWYERDFKYAPKLHTRVFLHFGAVNYRSTVWVNTEKVCEHQGGFTPFDCEVTKTLRDGDNFVILSADNTRRADGVPTLETDWWNYGGITRDVLLVDVPDRFIDDYDLHLNRADRSEIDGFVHIEGADTGTQVSVSIPELKVSAKAAASQGGRAEFKIPVTRLSLWSPGNPKLYHVKITAGPDSLEDEIGFRTIEARGTQILLNGEPIFLRGICIHAEAPYRTGRAYSEKDVEMLLTWVRELGANYVRLAHYPHDERMTRAADRMGILVWSEIPVYWAIQFDNPQVLENAQRQLTTMIRRDRDKASVILWSIANETPNTPARVKFLSTLAQQVRDLDSSRLVTAALLVRANGFTKIVDDPLGQYLDVVGTNEYIGWYEQKPESADQTTWQIAYQKPLIMSEFGGEAKAGLHGGEDERWTEEYQASIYKHQLGMLNRIPQLRGLSPWILMDFRSPNRLLPGVQDNFNRKGLVSDQGEKKQAFYVLQKAYQEKTVGKTE
jgi:beta-glucuronidase